MFGDHAKPTLFSNVCYFAPEKFHIRPARREASMVCGHQTFVVDLLSNCLLRQKTDLDCQFVGRRASHSTMAGSRQVAPRKIRESELVS